MERCHMTTVYPLTLPRRYITTHLQSSSIPTILLGGTLHPGTHSHTSVLLDGAVLTHTHTHTLWINGRMWRHHGDKSSQYAHTHTHHTQGERDTCCRQAVRARFSSSIRRIHPLSTSSSFPPSQALPPVMYRRSLGSSCLFPAYPSILAALHPIGSLQAPGLIAPFGRTVVFGPVGHCCIFLDSASTAPLLLLLLHLSSSPPLLLLLLLRYRNPARHRITSPFALARSLLPAVLVVTVDLPAAAPVCPSWCRSRQCSVGFQHAGARERKRGGAVHESCASAAPSLSLSLRSVTITYRCYYVHKLGSRGRRGVCVCVCGRNHLIQFKLVRVFGLGGEPEKTHASTWWRW